MTEQDLKVVGQSVLRRDGSEHVTGQTKYVDDIFYPGMLHLKMVRSPVPHARIRSVDFSEAEQVPGFVRALTHVDVPKNVYTILCLIGVGPDEEPVLAEDKVLYFNQPIAAIIAETEAAAMEAVSRVKLDLEELPAVFDVEEALQPDCSLEHRFSKIGAPTTLSTTTSMSRATPSARSGWETSRRVSPRPITSWKGAIRRAP